MNILVTGGAGFIGANCAKHFADLGHRVVVFDNLSRTGSETNALWLAESCGVKIVQGDVRREADLYDVFRQNGPFALALHFAAQVAVTGSVANPRNDFECNALGAFNVLEALRLYSPETAIIYSSTNKVYGGMEDVRIIERRGRYEFADLPQGVSEERGLDFHSPYGCSKGSADQYFRDYARIYGLKTVVLRQSCIYGYRQFGVEDQGWVAWFCIAAALGKKITVYGDGKQVRDVLFIDDLVQLYEKVFDRIETAKGKVFNVGGGTNHTLSLLELVSVLESVVGRAIPVSFGAWRSGDQRVFVSDISRVVKTFGWKPLVGVREGVEKLSAWVNDNITLIEKDFL
jgi:CDP-paratose 2-epimerase